MSRGSSQALLRLLHLSSPALPVGSFAFSQGLEWAIEQGAIDQEESLYEWWHGLLTEGLAYTDIPVLLRLHRAFAGKRIDEAQRWNREVLAMRETAELREEDLQVGQALIKLLESLGIDEACHWRRSPTSWLTAWSLAATQWQIDERDSALGFLWAWLENQVVAAGKILPLAQTPAQRLLMRLEPSILQAWEAGKLCEDEDIGQSLPGWVHACAQHETQYSRLFRS